MKNKNTCALDRLETSAAIAIFLCATFCAGIVSVFKFGGEALKQKVQQSRYRENQR